MRKIFLFVATALVATFIVIASTGSSKQTPRPGGSAGNCNPTVVSCNDPHNTRIQRNGNTYDLAFQGGMWIQQCIDTGTTPGGLWWRKQMVVGFHGTATEATLGTATIYLDSSQAQDTSIIVSNNIGEEFPAHHDVYAHARVTFSSEPGVGYRTKKPFHMYSTAITSFAVYGQPQTYNVAQDVQFENVASPGTTVFTMIATPMTVYPNP